MALESLTSDTIFLICHEKLVVHFHFQFEDNLELQMYIKQRMVSPNHTFLIAAITELEDSNLYCCSLVTFGNRLNRYNNGETGN